MTSPYLEKDYWDERYRKRGAERIGSASGTLAAGLGGGYNRYLYRLRRKAVEEVVADLNLRLPETSVLDIGCGTGYWSSFFREMRVAEYTGLDVSQVAVDAVSREYPEYTYRALDVGKPFDLKKTFGLINAFDVLYHITDDEKFELCLRNLSRHANPGGILLIADYFDDRQKISASHVRHRSYEFYERVLTEAGFEILALKPVFYYLSRAVGC